MTRHRRQREERTSSSRKTGLRATAASTPERHQSTAPGCAPTADACYPTWPKPLATRHNRVAASDPPEMPASSAWPTPPRDAARHGHHCGRSCPLGSSAYCTSHFRFSTGLDHLACVCRHAVSSRESPSPHTPPNLVVGGCRRTLIASRCEDLQVEHPVQG